jgi:hypothetical protein
LVYPVPVKIGQARAKLSVEGRLSSLVGTDALLGIHHLSLSQVILYPPRALIHYLAKHMEQV